MIELQKNEIAFPDPHHYHPINGLLAYGGDLSVERIWWAYQLGIFPWYNPDEPILWWCPDPRFVLFPKALKISKSMKKVFRKQIFTFTENTCFEEVMKNCQKAPRKDQSGTWITEELIATFLKLHQLGKAKSVEVWQNNQLAGGFYGLQIGKVFCGESMFSKVSNASKAGFIYFVKKYGNKINLIDCQIHSNHLESLGATMISKKEFLDYLPSVSS